MVIILAVGRIIISSSSGKADSKRSDIDIVPWPKGPALLPPLLAPAVLLPRLPRLMGIGLTVMLVQRPLLRRSLPRVWRLEVSW